MPLSFSSRVAHSPAAWVVRARDTDHGQRRPPVQILVRAPSSLCGRIQVTTTVCSIIIVACWQPFTCLPLQSHARGSHSRLASLELYPARTSPAEAASSSCSPPPARSTSQGQRALARCSSTRRPGAPKSAHRCLEGAVFSPGHPAWTRAPYHIDRRSSTTMIVRGASSHCLLLSPISKRPLAACHKDFVDERPGRGGVEVVSRRPHRRQA